MRQNWTKEELETIIREIIGAERKVIFDTGNSISKRKSAVKGIIERRIRDGVGSDT